MAVQGNQRLLTAQGQRAEQRRVLGFLADQRPARLWIFTGANEDRNVTAHGGQQGGRVQHFRTESRHFSRFFKGDHVNTFCRRDHARVGGVDTRHVRPDIHAGGVQGFAQQGGGVVAAATAQRGCASFGFAADKAPVITMPSSVRGASCWLVSSAGLPRPARRGQSGRWCASLYARRTTAPEYCARA